MWDIPVTNFPISWQIPWASGSFYHHTLGWQVGVSTFATTSIPVAPIYVPNQITLTSMGLESTTSISGTQARIALYEYTEEGGIGRLIVDAGVITILNATGFYSNSINKVVEQGWYQIVVAINGSSTLRVITSGVCNLVRGTIFPLNTNAQNWVTRITTATADVTNIITNGFPDSFSNNGWDGMIGIVGNNIIPRILIGT